jgi:hypothetical protein
MEDGEQSIVYKRCTIAYSSQLDTELLRFMPRAAITWEMSKGGGVTYFLRTLQSQTHQKRRRSRSG